MSDVAARQGPLVFEALSSSPLVWQLPRVAPPDAILIAAHGCRASGRVWFPDAPAFGKPVRSPLPEESCIASRALEAGFAVIAPSSSGDCWRGEDLKLVWSAIAKLRNAQPLLSMDLPLFMIGTSSGGWFAGQAARSWPTVAAVATIVMALPLSDVRPPLPRGTPFPPLQMIYMERDRGKATEVQALLTSAWPQRQEVEALSCSPRRVHPLYFSERIMLSANLSRSVQVGRYS